MRFNPYAAQRGPQVNQNWKTNTKKLSANSYSFYFFLRSRSIRALSSSKTVSLRVKQQIMQCDPQQLPIQIKSLKLTETLATALDVLIHSLPFCYSPSTLIHLSLSLYNFAESKTVYIQFLVKILFVMYCRSIHQPSSSATSFFIICHRNLYIIIFLGNMFTYFCFHNVIIKASIHHYIKRKNKN